MGCTLWQCCQLPFRLGGPKFVNGLNQTEIFGNRNSPLVLCHRTGSLWIRKQKKKIKIKTRNDRTTERNYDRATIQLRDDRISDRIGIRDNRRTLRIEGGWTIPVCLCRAWTTFNVPIYVPSRPGEANIRTISCPKGRRVGFAPRAVW